MNPGGAPPPGVRAMTGTGGEPAAPDRAPRPFVDRALDAVIAATALSMVALFLSVALHRIDHPFELEWMEGAFLDHVNRVLDGRPLYAAPTVEFVPFLYTPLFMTVAAAASAVAGEGFFAARLVSVAASLGTVCAPPLRRPAAHRRVAARGRRGRSLRGKLRARGFLVRPGSSGQPLCLLRPRRSLGDPLVSRAHERDPRCGFAVARVLHQADRVDARPSVRARARAGRPAARCVVPRCVRRALALGKRSGRARDRRLVLVLHLGGPARSRVRRVEDRSLLAGRPARLASRTGKRRFFAGPRSGRGRCSSSSSVGSFSVGSGPGERTGSPASFRTERGWRACSCRPCRRECTRAAPST